MGGLALVLVLNFVISCWNAFVSGMYWTEKRDLPAHIRFLIWCGAAMAVIGFFIVYAVVIVFVTQQIHAFEFLAKVFLKRALEPEEVTLIVQNVFDLANSLIIVPLLGIGAAITAHSLSQAWKRKDALSIGVAAYNSFAMVHNVTTAARVLPKAIASLGNGLRKNKSFGYIVILALPLILSLGGAIFTTAAIMRASDAKYQLGDMRPDFS